MSQKYKFFIKNYSVTFRKSGFSDVSGSASEVVISTKAELEKAAKLLRESSLSGDLFFEVAESLPLKKILFAELPVIVAGGGLVFDPDGRLLMIHRRGFWDLPKGKVEAGESLEETAMREVEEECGVVGLSIDSEPFETYHIYSEKGRPTIKRSVWYKMHCSPRQEPSPQLEEDITKAEWVEMNRVQPLGRLAYKSIQDVLHHFLGLSFSDTSGG